MEQPLEGKGYAREQLKKSRGLVSATLWHAIAHVIYTYLVLQAILAQVLPSTKVPSTVTWSREFPLGTAAPFEEFLLIIIHYLDISRSVYTRQSSATCNFSACFSTEHTICTSVSRQQATMQGAAVHVPVHALIPMQSAECRALQRIPAVQRGSTVETDHQATRRLLCVSALCLSKFFSEQSPLTNR